MKQVILLRNDLNMSPGKAAAQAAHAAMLFLLDKIQQVRGNTSCPYSCCNQTYPHKHGWGDAIKTNETPFSLTKEEQEWAFKNGPIYGKEGPSITYGGMKKIILGVKNLSELWLYHWCAKEKGLKVFNVFDEGLDCVTACAIGPSEDAYIDDLTRTLPLYGPSEMEAYRHPMNQPVHFACKTSVTCKEKGCQKNYPCPWRYPFGR